MLTDPLFAKENNDLVKANYYYEHMAFAQAIRYYERIEGRSNDVKISTLLGDCYRLTNDMEMAAQWYSKAVSMEGCSDTVKLRYGQVLMQLMRYEEAEKMLSAYQMAAVQDKRTANLITGCRIAGETYKNSTAKDAKLLDLSTNGSEFAPVFWKGRLVFTADTSIGMKKKKDNWTGHAYCHIYYATCNDDGSCGSSLNAVSADRELNGIYHTGPCSFTADGKTMYYSSTNYSSSIRSRLASVVPKPVAQLQIMVASGYDDASKRFASFDPFQYNSDAYSVTQPAISPDGSILVFCSDMPGGAGGTDLYICTRTKDGAWSKPQNLGSGINTEGREMFPGFIDNKTLYFSSDGHPGFGGLDIFECQFDRSGKVFSAIRNAGVPYNSSYDDMSFVKTAAGVYFSSNRPSAKKGDNIYFYGVPGTKPQYVQDRVIASSQDKADSSSKVAEAAPGSKQTAPAKVNDMAAKGDHPLPVTAAGSNDRVVQAGDHVAPLPQTGKESDLEAIKTSTKGIHPGDATAGTAVAKQGPGQPHTAQAGGSKADDRKAADGVPGKKPALPQHANAATLSTAGNILDKSGMPATAFVVGESYKLPGFHYGFNKSDIVRNAIKELETLYAVLVKYPNMHIQINAFTDCRGREEYNLKLSYIRAKAVVNYLENKGIAHGRVKWNGFGETKPVVSCPVCNECTEYQHQQNRSIEFVVTRM